MSGLLIKEEVYDDLDRIIEHLIRFEVVDPEARITEILDALKLLTHSPLIGRPSKRSRRELVIGRDSRGCVALYHYDRRRDAVTVLAIRSQREDGYKRA